MPLVLVNELAAPPDLMRYRDHVATRTLDDVPGDPTVATKRMQEEVDRSREMLMMGVQPSLEHLVSAYVAFTDKALFDCGGELTDDVLLWLLQGWQAIADTLLAVRPLWAFDKDDAIYQRFLDLGSHLAELAICSENEETEVAEEGDHVGEPFRVVFDAEDYGSVVFAPLARTLFQGAGRDAA